MSDEVKHRNILRGASFSILIGLIAMNSLSHPHWVRIPFLILNAGFNSFANALTALIYWRRLEQTIVRSDPLFVIGHWRSGTTLLHELITLDPQNNSPTTYQCFAPGHFLLTEKYLIPLLKYFLPKKRPMDDVKIGWDKPQEDEFALLQLGAPSFYRKIAFPSCESPSKTEALDLALLPADSLCEWKNAMRYFVKRLSFKDTRRLVFKSPTHTAHIKILLELYPQARFIHIVRSPSEVFASTDKLWRSLFGVYGLRTYDRKLLESMILKSFDQMYAAFDRDSPLIQPDRIVDMRYEDLVLDPVACVNEA